MYLQRLNPLRGGKIPDIPTERTASTEQNASFWRLLTFAWLSPLMNTGYKRHLERNDIWLVPDSRAIQSLQGRVKNSFKERVSVRSRLPLTWALYETFKFDLWLGGICQFLVSILQVMAPFTLRYLIKFAKDAYNASHLNQKPPPTAVGIGYVLGITVMQILQSFASSHSYYRGMLLGGQIRSTLVALILDKSLKLSRRAKAGGKPEGQEWKADTEGWSNGRIMNLISTDASRIEQACGVFHLVWTSPIQIVLTVALLVYNLGYNALAGVAVLVCGLAALTNVMRFLTTSRAAINKITDQRVDITQEILQGIRFVKNFAWEGFFLNRLKTIRADESQALRLMNLIRSAIGAVSMALPIFSNMTAFVVFSVSSHKLEPSVIFSSLALFNSLRTPMNWLPVSIGYVIDAYISLKRMENFLLAEEVTSEIAPTSDQNCAIQLDRASFTWEVPSSNKPGKQNEGEVKRRPLIGFWKGQRKEKRFPQEQIPPTQLPSQDITVFRLNNISFQAGHGELIGIIGSVGCGKTSLLSALASDMRQTGGIMQLSADRAYCPQYAWVQNASVQDNIIFGRPFDQTFYSKVVQACALLPDFEALPDGDMTEIGERGITLSGGQKQRINIARAIYSDASIVLLDDPLSAVDAHVGAHIFNEAICGLLGSKCRVLATHQIHFLARFDKIIWMADGHIEATGTYHELLHTNAAFAKLITAGGAQYNNAGNSERKDHVTIEDDIIADSTGAERSPQQLMQEDVKAVDSVPWPIYVAWLRASGSLWNIFAVLLMQTVFRASDQHMAFMVGLQQIRSFSRPKHWLLRGSWLNTSQTMSNEAMWQILRAPVAFFDTTPLGRIIHRFTKDLDAMDNNLTSSLQQYLIVLSALVGMFVLIIAYFYYFAIALAVCILALLWCVSYYRSSARELKRHHAILDGAVFARFNEALVGAPCIRAYGREHQFIQMLHKSIDDMDGAYFLTFADQHWLSLRLDNIGNLLNFATGILVITNRLSVSPSIGGLILSYSLSLTGIIQIVIRYFVEVDNSMSSTERLYQYTTSLVQEGPLEGAPVRATWPERGAIRYEAVQMRYRPELPLVIDGFSLQIAGGERIGIVGRTGAGKSTIMSTLFRLTEISGGRITIDDVDISQIGIHDLRSCLAIIPQDPTLFRGTIRSNLDPFNKHTDLELWDALRQAHLNPDKAVASEVGKGKNEDNMKYEVDGSSNSDQLRVTLDTVVEEEGLNFSLGQRQLIALARALLRNARIVLVDEGTSSVDPKTDIHIQSTLTRGMKGKTLVAIAHRLRTVLQYDRVCVMDKGKIAELGSPLELWERGGIFRSMCDNNSITRVDFIQQLW
ncbi:multidrug resistance-associated protein [Xylogone sp. PMI_703]|nr:multidrug resistance-associated protein [Xylogone sp. PMI_703]